jgi:cobalt-zinc-cadmium efflux system membrane fusion protein
LIARAEYSGTPCEYHGVADSLCTRCHPALIDGFKQRNDWCAEHHIPESQCSLCHPELAKPREAPAPHDQSEHEGDDHAEQEETSATSESGKPRTSLFRANKGHCASDDAVIQLASIQTAERAGLKFLTVSEAPVSEFVEASAEVEFDATAAYAVTSLLGGTIVRWLAQPGEFVERGEILAFCESFDAASLKAEHAHAAAIFDLAQSERERQTTLATSGLTSSLEVQKAEAEFSRAQADKRKAESSLKAAGLSQEEIDELTCCPEMDVTIPIRARVSGTLVEQRSELGAIIEPGETIGLIAETGKLWVEAQVRERDLSRIRVGQAALLSSDGEAWNRCSGDVVWVANSVDELTRMGRVRIAVNQNGESLRAHEFVRVKFEVNSADEMVIPSESVQWDGCCNVVFVAETPDRIKPRKVDVHFTNGSNYAVGGLKSGEKIITSGSYLLKTELMKGSLGAGCVGCGA